MNAPRSGEGEPARRARNHGKRKRDVVLCGATPPCTANGSPWNRCRRLSAAASIRALRSAMLEVGDDLMFDSVSRLVDAAVQGNPGARTAMQYAVDLINVPAILQAHIHQGPQGDTTSASRCRHFT